MRTLDVDIPKTGAAARIAVRKQGAGAGGGAVVGAVVVVMALGVAIRTSPRLETVTDKARLPVPAEFDLMRDFLKYHVVINTTLSQIPATDGSHKRRLVLGDENRLLLTSRRGRSATASGTAGSGELRAAKYENEAAVAAGGSAGDSVGDPTSIAPILAPEDLS
eukprot:jgi/Tetstr1/458027/TSEL_044536.t1